jgi:hypothetical protein
MPSEPQLRPSLAEPGVHCVCGVCGRVVPGWPTRLGNWCLRAHKHEGSKCRGMYTTRGHRLLP